MILYRFHGKTFLDFLQAIQLHTDDDFRDKFFTILKECPFRSYYWETPCTSLRTVSAIPFEFVLVNSKTRNRQPNPSDFYEHFQKTNRNVVAFKNLSGDALLIVPTPQTDIHPTVFLDISSFMRNANVKLISKLWATVGKQLIRMYSTMATSRFWLSTSGDGVNWLHVRIDTVPKYYKYKTYTSTKKC